MQCEMPRRLVRITLESNGDAEEFGRSVAIDAWPGFMFSPTNNVYQATFLLRCEQVSEAVSICIPKPDRVVITELRPLLDPAGDELVNIPGTRLQLEDRENGLQDGE